MQLDTADPSLSPATDEVNCEWRKQSEYCGAGQGFVAVKGMVCDILRLQIYVR